MKNIDDKNTYYKTPSKIAKPLRKFHNFIKTVMINNYCNNLDVLDLGFGRGGDIKKYVEANVTICVGVDIDYNGLFTINDSASKRLKKFKNIKTNFVLIHGDASKKLYLNDQKNSNEDNSKKIKNYFGEKDKNKHYEFDIINMQFMIHYLFENENSFLNVCYNVSEYLKKNGYLLITTMDGDKVFDLLENNNGEYSCNYTDDFGNNVELFKIVKQYNKKTDFGCAIGVYISIFMNDDNLYTEYLVFPNVLIENLAKKCNAYLIESNSFKNVYDQYEYFFINENTNLFNDIKNLYQNKNSANVCCLKFTELFKYYVFQKK